MKGYLFIAAALSVARIHCSDCPNNDLQTECLDLVCGPHFHVECLTGICTCNPNASHFCLKTTDCYELYFNGTLTFCADSWHCVDNGCRCIEKVGN
ncbi:serine protease inhibitor Cvsi-2-like [Ruditapes philippinarum]|uniref:serine protease inhibitor Cvsi-2-like n=1 Tax=Ruditapes philippinarum TaxID=129788 RepID=UPI00295B8C2C|nr:serine protease inhibitor Cvsi-2-like [Ruditapes philippinarum]